jgi:hypothetical protein
MNINAISVVIHLKLFSVWVLTAATWNVRNAAQQNRKSFSLHLPRPAVEADTRVVVPAVPVVLPEAYNRERCAPLQRQYFCPSKNDTELESFINSF